MARPLAAARSSAQPLSAGRDQDTVAGAEVGGGRGLGGAVLGELRHGAVLQRQQFRHGLAGARRAARSSTRPARSSAISKVAPSNKV